MSSYQKVREKLFPGFKTIFAVLGLFLLLPGLAQAEMANNLSNPGCVSCHLNFPVQHPVSNCSPCHGGYLPGTTPSPNLAAMWNCRYCHLTMVYDTYPVSSTGLGYPDWTGSISGFRSWGAPLHNGPLGNRDWWQAGHYGNGSPEYLPPNPPRVDADFNYHNNSQGFQHTSVFPGQGPDQNSDQGCAACHKNTLTAAHEGKTKTIINPTEDFEDGAFTFNFTGYWGGEFTRVSETAYSGAYSFKSMLVGGSTRYSPTPSATTETTVDAGANGTVSFAYKVVNSGKFSFYIDDVEMLAGGTSTAWTPLTYSLTPGSHKLKWKSTWSSTYIDDLSITGASTTYTMDCNTCHLSSDTSVKTAISNHNTNCSSCHASWDHETPHIGSLDGACRQCHQQVLTGEHFNNSVTQATYDPTTGKTELTCGTCHANTGKAVVRTIEANNLKCAGCHQEGHKVNFVEQVPADIMLYPTYRWSTPMEASLFTGEPGAPAGYENGQVIVSNRQQDSLLNNLFSDYLVDMGSNGWTRLTEESVPTWLYGFTQEYEKGGRKATVICYSTENRDYKQGEPIGTGYRIEIWYQ